MHAPQIADVRAQRDELMLQKKKSGGDHTLQMRGYRQRSSSSSSSGLIASFMCGIIVSKAPIEQHTWQLEAFGKRNTFKQKVDNSVCIQAQREAEAILKAKTADVTSRRTKQDHADREVHQARQQLQNLHAQAGIVTSMQAVLRLPSGRGRGAHQGLAAAHLCKKLCHAASSYHRRHNLRITCLAVGA